MNLLVLTIFLVFADCIANEECPIDPCPELYQEVGDECFYISMGDECWKDARQFCVDMGAELAVPNDVDALKAFAFSYTNKRGVWIGGSDSASEGDWSTYINGEPIQGSDWYAGQPSDYAGGEDCLEIRNLFSPPLNDYRCAFAQPFVCEVPRTPNRPTCNPRGTLIGGECFELFEDDEDWDDARAACIALGGDLAMPCDLTTFITWAYDGSDGDDIWLGATDQNNEGVWKWLNGDPIYTHDWPQGQPNNSGDIQDCLEVESPNAPPFNDANCADSQNYACEYPPVYV